MGDVENLEYTNDRGMGITVYCGKRKGSASTSDLTESAIREAVARARSFARYTAEDPHAGLADAALMATEIPDLMLDHPWAIAGDGERDGDRLRSSGVVPRPPDNELRRSFGLDEPRRADLCE